MMLFSQGIFATIIDFVTWPPLQISSDGTKGGQVTKSIIVMKFPARISSFIYIRNNNKVSTSWPSLILNVLVAYNFTSDWPHTFFTPRVFLFSISL